MPGHRKEYHEQVEREEPKTDARGPRSRTERDASFMQESG